MSKLRYMTVLVAAIAMVFASAPPVGAVDGSERVTTVFQGSLAGEGDDEFNSFFDVAVDNDGNVFILGMVGLGTFQVRKVTPDGDVTVVAGAGGQGDGPDQLDIADNIAVDDDGNLFVADLHNHRVQKISPDGATTTIAGGNGEGLSDNQLSYPYGLALNVDGDLFVSSFDHGTSQVREVLDDGTTAVVFETTDFLFGAIAFDSGDNLFLSDTNNARVIKVTPDGTVTTVAGGNGKGDAADQLNDAAGLAFDADGNLYIAEFGGHRVQRLAPDGTITTIAGGNGEGDAPNQLAHPYGVTLGPDQSLYIADAGNSRIQRMTPGDIAPEPVDPPAPCSRVLEGTHAESTGSSAAIARLYMATFNRQPDQAGFNYWNNSIEGRTATIDFAAEHFAASDEFQTTYGQLSNTEFLNQLYNNIMCRNPDQTGQTYWLNQLGNGTTRGRIILLFSDSPEFRTLTNTN